MESDVNPARKVFQPRRGEPSPFFKPAIDRDGLLVLKVFHYHVKHLGEMETTASSKF